MDRRLIVASATLLLSFTGCATSQYLSSPCRSSVQSPCRSVGRDQCGSQETCEPLIKSPKSCCPDSCGDTGGCSPCKNNDCGCAGGEGCNNRRRGLAGGFERGRKNVLLDGAGWVVGIPSKLLLWNTKVDSHNVSPETEQQLRKYLVARGLSDVKVRVNQYDPIGEWKRLAANKEIHAGWKYTVGAFTLTKYTLLPGRFFGNDEYNPFTNSISLFSDRASIALREGAHAKNADEAAYPGLYAACSYLPGSPMWIDATATSDVIRYSQETNQQPLEREAYLVLFPSYGARLGQSLTFFVDAGQGQAAQAGFALVGHAVGRTMAMRVSETPMQMVKAAYGIVKRPQKEEAPAQDTAEIQNPLPPEADFHVTFVPLDVSYDWLDES